MSMMASAVEAGSGASVTGAHQTKRAMKALSALPDRVRSAFVLVRFEGQSCRDVSMRLGVSVCTVERDLALALRALTESLDA